MPEHLEELVRRRPSTIAYIAAIATASLVLQILEMIS